MLNNPEVKVTLINVQTGEREVWRKLGIYNTISNLKSSIINTNLSKKELLENFLKGNNVIINIIELGELQSGTTSGYQEVIMEEKEHLTKREKEILRWFCFPSKEIAKFLFISECTVKSHVHSILKKLKAKTKSQAIILSLVMGEIKLDEIIKPPNL